MKLIHGKYPIKWFQVHWHISISFHSHGLEEEDLFQSFSSVDELCVITLVLF